MNSGVIMISALWGGTTRDEGVERKEERRKRAKRRGKRGRKSGREMGWERVQREKKDDKPELRRARSERRAQGRH